MAAADTSAGSAGSSPATTSRSSGPIHGGDPVVTMGSPVTPPSAAAIISPAAPAAPRPATQITLRGRWPSVTGASRPSSTAACTART